MTEHRTHRPSLVVTAAAALDTGADPRPSHGAEPAGYNEQDVFDRLATWLADVSAEAALTGNGTH